jgi:hypothetical protein
LQFGFPLSESGISRRILTLVNLCRNRQADKLTCLAQVRLLLRLYIRPLDTFSRILDEGQLLFAVIAAVAVTLALQLPRAVEFHRQESNAAARAAMQQVDRVVAKEVARKRTVTAEQVRRDLEEEGYFDGLPGAAGPPPFDMRSTASRASIRPSTLRP